jgi:hypothetical protein
MEPSLFQSRSFSGVKNTYPLLDEVKDEVAGRIRLDSFRIAVGLAELVTSVVKGGAVS